MLTNIRARWRQLPATVRGGVVPGLATGIVIGLFAGLTPGSAADKAAIFVGALAIAVAFKGLLVSLEVTRINADLQGELTKLSLGAAYEIAERGDEQLQRIEALLERIAEAVAPAGITTEETPDAAVDDDTPLE